MHSCVLVPPKSWRGKSWLTNSTMQCLLLTTGVPYCMSMEDSLSMSVIDMCLGRRPAFCLSTAFCIPHNMDLEDYFRFVLRSVACVTVLNCINAWLINTPSSNTVPWLCSDFGRALSDHSAIKVCKLHGGAECDTIFMRGNSMGL